MLTKWVGGSEKVEKLGNVIYEWSLDSGQAALTTTYVFQSTEFKMQFAFSNESLGVFPFCLEAEFHPNMCMMSEMGSRV